MILIHGYIHRLLHMFRRLLIESAQGFGEEPPGRFAALAGQHLRTTRLAPLRICRVVSREGAFHAEEEVKLMCVCERSYIYIYIRICLYILYTIYGMYYGYGHIWPPPTVTFSKCCIITIRTTGWPKDPSPSMPSTCQVNQPYFPTWIMVISSLSWDITWTNMI